MSQKTTLNDANIPQFTFYDTLRRQECRRSQVLKVDPRLQNSKNLSKLKLHLIIDN